jgi:NTE family protein
VLGKNQYPNAPLFQRGGNTYFLNTRRKENMEYDMVFEGGGAKGMAFVGALQELEARGHTPARLLGASAGAIMSTFLAAGYDSREMAEALAETEDGQPVFLGFLEAPSRPAPEEIQNSAIRQLLRDVNLKIIPDFLEDRVDDAIANLIATSPRTSRIYSFIDKGGFYQAKRFLSWLREKLNCGIYPLERGAFGKGKERSFGDMDLAQFKEATGVDLSLVASDTTSASILILNSRTAPNCPVVWAVRMSMSFPLLWQEVVWQPEWGNYRGKNISGHTVVDGGMLSNFPIELFISNLKHVTQVMGEKATDQFHVLGLLIDEGLEVQGEEQATPSSGGFEFSKLQTVQRVMKLINTMTQAHDKKVIEAYERLVIRLPAKGYGTIEFGMSEERRNALVNAGRSAAERFFRKLEAEQEMISFSLTGPAPLDVSFANRISSKILGE